MKPIRLIGLLAVVASLVLDFAILDGCRSERIGGPAYITPPTNVIPSSTWLTQSTWYIDPQNSTGHASDSNACSSSSAPCLTAQEFSQRLGTGLIKQNTYVFFLSNGKVSDPLDLQMTLGVNVIFAIYGGPNATSDGGMPTYTLGSGSTALAAGTFSSVTALARSTNQFEQVADTTSQDGGTGLTWTSYVNDFGRITSGTHAGAVFGIMKDLGSNTARVSQPVTLSLPNLSPSSSALSASTDNYQVDQQTIIYLGVVKPTFDLNGPYDGGSISAASVLAIVDAELGKTNVSATLNISSLGRGLMLFQRCKFDSLVVSDGPGIVEIFGSLLVSQWTAFSGALVLEGTQASTVQILDGLAEIGIGTDVSLQGGTGLFINGGSNVIGGLGCADTTASVGTNYRGSCVQVGASPQSSGNAGFGFTQFGTLNSGVCGGCSLYGTGMAGYGLDVMAGNTASWAGSYTFAATQSSRDFILGGTTSNGVTIATQPATYSGAITESWSNFSLPVADGGFGGYAHNLQTNTHLVQSQ